METCWFCCKNSYIATFLLNFLDIFILTSVFSKLRRSCYLKCELCFLCLCVFLFFSDNSGLIELAERNLQSLKQSFERMAIEETTNGQYCPALIGEVFVRKALAEICLKVCEEFPPDVTCLTPPDEAENTTSCSDVILTLLRSSEYEVRLAVLEFIIFHLPSDTNISRDYEVDLRHSTEYGRTDSWVFGKLDSRVKSELFTMAMEVEHHTECLVKVTHSFLCLLLITRKQNSTQYVEQVNREC